LTFWLKFKNYKDQEIEADETKVKVKKPTKDRSIKESKKKPEKIKLST